MKQSLRQPERYEPWLQVRVEQRESGIAGMQQACKRRIPYAQAVREALEQAMELDPNVFVMGQGVDDPSGMFGTTRGLHEEYGRERSFDTPLAETSLMGVAVGAALGGMRPVYFHNRPDFLYLAMDQLVNHASKWHYMFGGAASVPLVVWACIGRGWGSAAQHSQAPQGIFMNVPGLKLLMPGTAYDAKGLMLAAIKDPNPVLILEHRQNLKCEGIVPQEPYYLPIGKGAVRRPGRDVTIVAVSHMVHEARQAAADLEAEGIDAEIIDPRSLIPLDEEIILASVEKTGRAVICDTGWKTAGVTSEIAALLAEKGLHSLKAPVKRLACPDLPTPAGFTLEEAFYPNAKDIVAAALEVCN